MKNDWEGVALACAAGLLVIANVLAFTLSTKAPDSQTSAVAAEQEFVALELHYGRETAVGIVRHNCQGDMLSFIQKEQHHWRDAWCARHYSHLLEKAQ